MKQLMTFARLIFIAFSLVWFGYTVSIAITEYEKVMAAGIYLAIIIVLTMWTDLASKGE